MDLPPFDVKSLCVKCGYVIPDPVAPEPKVTKGLDGKATTLPAAPPPPPQPPTCLYCNGDDCEWDEDSVGLEEHMHQYCDVCSYEWLSQPLG